MPELTFEKLTKEEVNCELLKFIDPSPLLKCTVDFFEDDYYCNLVQKKILEDERYNFKYPLVLLKICMKLETISLDKNWLFYKVVLNANSYQKAISCFLVLKELDNEFYVKLFLDTNTIFKKGKTNAFSNF